MLHVQNCCFAYQTYCFFDVPLVVAVVVAKAPYWNLEKEGRLGPKLKKRTLNLKWNFQRGGGGGGVEMIKPIMGQYFC